MFLSTFPARFVLFHEQLATLVTIDRFSSRIPMLPPSVPFFSQIYKLMLSRFPIVLLNVYVGVCSRFFSRKYLWIEIYSIFSTYFWLFVAFSCLQWCEMEGGLFFLRLFVMRSYFHMKWKIVGV